MYIPRKHARIEHHDQVFLKVLKSTNEEKIRSGRTLLCYSINMSVRGLCLELPLELPQGCRVEVWLKSKQDEGSIRVVGRVIWGRAVSESGQTRIGIQLVKKDGDDLEEHQKRVARQLLSTDKS